MLAGRQNRRRTGASRCHARQHSAAAGAAPTCTHLMSALRAATMARFFSAAFSSACCVCECSRAFAGSSTRHMLRCCPHAAPDHSASRRACICVHLVEVGHLRLERLQLLAKRVVALGLAPLVHRRVILAIPWARGGRVASVRQVQWLLLLRRHMHAGWLHRPVACARCVSTHRPATTHFLRMASVRCCRSYRLMLLQSGWLLGGYRVLAASAWPPAAAAGAAAAGRVLHTRRVSCCGSSTRTLAAPWLAVT